MGSSSWCYYCLLSSAAVAASGRCCCLQVQADCNLQCSLLELITALEACCRYRMLDKTSAIAALLVHISVVSEASATLVLIIRLYCCRDMNTQMSLVLIISSLRVSSSSCSAHCDSFLRCVRLIVSATCASTVVKLQYLDVHSTRQCCCSSF
jgi:hypothetical protein